MKFALDSETVQFAESVDAMLSRADVPAAIRAWRDGDTAPGLRLWASLAEQGVWALLLPEDADGMGATPVEAVAIAEVLGRHAVPGPVVETLFLAPHVATATGDAALRGALGEGAPVTVAAADVSPLAPGVDVADSRWLLDADGGVHDCPSPAGSRASVDGARRVAELAAPDDAPVAATDRDVAVDLGALGTAAYQLGLASRMLRMAVDYATQRAQFGRPIGEQQAIKHKAADVAIAVEMARPLVWSGALALSGGDRARASRDVSAAAVACAGAASIACRNALQIHGAIGYTMEHDLGLYLTRSRALRASWGTEAFHRRRVLDAIEAGVVR